MPRSVRIRQAARAAACLFVSAAAAAVAAPVRLVDQAPVRIDAVAPGVALADFGRAAFGNLCIVPPAGARGEITVHFGEALAGGRVNRQPPGSVRYAPVRVVLDGRASIIVAPPPDARNTRPPSAILTPPGWGVVLPFRWVEIEGWPGEIRAGHIVRRAAFAAAWDDGAASFRSSDGLLDRIWELCRYSIKATTFAGVYVDGDRERIPYEADAYISQISHYATDRDVQMARDTFDRLMRHPTWPTEWAFHMVFMAHAEWMHTGDLAWLRERYEALKPKLLLDRARADGLLASSEAQRTREDIVDWPAGERDGFVFTPVNTVVNAFHLRSLALMAELADAVGRTSEAEGYRQRARTARTAFQQLLFDRSRLVYRDGEGTDHASLHASLFPLAFGLVPSEHVPPVIARLSAKGMACSVYAAQYLLEGLFEHDAAAQALALMTAQHDRSWRHMVDSGATITWEAWDQKYKPNLDWNHAWGAAPANLLPRFVLGAQPLAPGWLRARVRPRAGSLSHAAGTIPTPRGPIRIGWSRETGFRMRLDLPPGMSARVDLPAEPGSLGVYLRSTPVRAERVGAYWRLAEDVRGSVVLDVR
ncbi:MAG TPA: family 78 glycoside hydrolase catalytic domain [Vicinamibacterales bacterium]|nr:family 78 glycoside hydrolase catalytic domain [Vicinamibacterales bacterium]